MRKVLLAIATLIVLYGAWPYWSVWRLYTVVSANDSSALAQRVDWVGFRANFKTSLLDRLHREGNRITIGVSVGGLPGQFSFTLTPETVNQVVDHYATPERLPELLLLEGLIRPPTQGTPHKSATTTPSRERRRVTWAFFASPTVFEVYVALPQRPDERIVPVLELQGSGWKLTNIRFVANR